jgi:hypothetical protein
MSMNISANMVVKNEEDYIEQAIRGKKIFRYNLIVNAIK